MQEKQADLLPRLKEKVSTPEGAPRLFDLIKVQDERMKLAFFAALGNTVVAKDIDQVSYIYILVDSSLPYEACRNRMLFSPHVVEESLSNVGEQCAHVAYAKIY